MIKLTTIADDRSGRKGGKYAETQRRIYELLEEWIDMYVWRIEDFIDCDPLMIHTDAAKNGRVYKPWCIQQTLLGMQDGDYLIYNDCSPELWDSLPDPVGFDFSIIRDLCDRANGFLVPFVEWAPQSIRAGEHGIHQHRHFTLNSCLDIMGASHLQDSYLCASGMIVIRKEPATVAIVDNWLHYCCIPECSTMHSHECEAAYNDPRPLKMGNRHDQSVLSTLLNIADWNYCLPAYVPGLNPHNFLNFCVPGWKYKFLNSNRP